MINRLPKIHEINKVYGTKSVDCKYWIPESVCNSDFDSFCKMNHIENPNAEIYKEYLGATFNNEPLGWDFVRDYYLYQDRLYDIDIFKASKLMTDVVYNNYNGILFCLMTEDEWNHCKVREIEAKSNKDLFLSIKDCRNSMKDNEIIISINLNEYYHRIIIRRMKDTGKIFTYDPIPCFCLEKVES